ncbi:MAG: hypothetical protein IT437_01770 [Phycisphaerales bacterium]|nr:hypothetical protein [Phycisphaerales bacterium]
MPADPLDSRLAAVRPAAAEPPPALVSALRHRRRSHRAAALGGVLAASLALAAGLWVGLRPHSAPPGSHIVAADSHYFLPTIRALSAANPAMDADNLRLPSIATGSVTEPITVRSFDEVGG